MPNQKCKLCSTDIDDNSIIRSGLKGDTYFECRRCGKYSINDLVFLNNNIDNISNFKAIISYWVKKNQTKEKPPYLDSELVTRILKETKLPDITEQINNLLIFLRKLSDIPGYIYELTLNDLVAEVGSIDIENLLFVFDYLKDNKFINVLRPQVNEDTLTVKAVRMIKFRLTVQGLQKIEEINKMQLSYSTEFNYRKHIFSNDEMIWFEELFKIDFYTADLKQLKVKFWGKVSESFDSAKIDRRFVRNNRLTLIGLWYIDPKNKLFTYCEEIIAEIKNTIKNDPSIIRIVAKELALKLNIPERQTKISLTLLSDFGFFNGGERITGEEIFYAVHFGQEGDAFDELLKYKTLENAMEKFYNQNSVSVINAKPTSFPIISNKYNLTIGEDGWELIYNEFKITKPGFGKKINFVTDKQKRLIIFRDVEQAYLLSRNGFSKPAIILSGSVIEELLRLYLDSKGIKSNRKTFDDYIKICEENKYLTKAVRLLSDSVRHFRNFVHLEQETDFKKSITPSMAQGAVASIFTVVNEF